MSKLKTKFIILCLVLFLSVIVNQTKILAESKKVNFTSSNLPIVIINTYGQNIPYDDPRIVADMGIIYNGIGTRNYVSDPFNNYSGKISIEIRGSSSAGWSKKSYGLETQNNDGSNRSVSLLGFPEENDWILYAPYYDRSFLRNVLVYKLANEMGWYASRTKFCELVLNGAYKGIYVFMEKIKRDKNRVDIAKLNPDEITGDDVTGGYIIKIDKEPEKPGFDSNYSPFPGAWQTIRYQYHYPKANDIVPQQEEYIRNFLDEFEDVMSGSNYADPLNGYPRYINVESFIDYFILNELSKNVDAYRLSAFFYKDKDSNGGKLTAGPAWDYNFSFGNAGYYDSQYIHNWQLDFFTENSDFKQGDYWQVPFWWEKLVNEPTFAEQLQNRWQQLRQNILNITRIHQYLDAVADTLDEAQQRNFEIWIGPGDPKLPEDGWFPPTDPIDHLKTYADEIQYLKYWLQNRIYWIDQNISALVNVSHNKNKNLPVSFLLKQNYPNPFNPKTVIEFELLKKEFVELTVLNAQGETVQTLVKGTRHRGVYQLKFNSSNLVSGIYFYKLKIGSGEQLVKKMIVIK